MTRNRVGMPLTQLTADNLSIQGNHRFYWGLSDGIALIVNGPVRHYHFSYGAISIEAEELEHGLSGKGVTYFHLGRNHTGELASRLTNPPIDEGLTARLLGSRSVGDFGYQGDQRFNPEYFDCVPLGIGGDGFKVLRNGSDTLLYLCQNATEGEGESEVVESLVRLNDKDRNALAGTLANHARTLASREYSNTIQSLLTQPASFAATR